MADLRRALNHDIKARVVAEINKDFANGPAWEIERHVVASLAEAEAPGARF